MISSFSKEKKIGRILVGAREIEKEGKRSKEKEIEGMRVKVLSKKLN